MHDVFVTAFVRIGQLRNPASLKPWLVSIAVYTARAHVRRRRRERAWHALVGRDRAETQAITADAETHEALDATYRVLDRMSVDERIVFALRHIEGMKLEAMAEACAVSLATVKRRLKRADERFSELARDEPALLPWLLRGQR